MASNAQSNINRDVLLRTWARLSVYDQTAVQLKQHYTQRRSLVISLTLVASVASVLTGIIGLNFIAIVLFITGVTLPIVSTYLMNDIIKFTGTTSWIKYRYIAETMRMHIYLYRMKAGPYAAVPWHQADDVLSANIRQVREEIKLDEVIPFSVKEPSDEKDIISAIEKANATTRKEGDPGDDGLSEMKLEDYIRWRVIDQRKWYDDKLLDDYTRLKENMRLAQVFLLAGALISALAGIINIQVVALVAITNAISIALTAWSNVSMFGKTYSLYQVASMELGDKLSNWYAQQNNPEFLDPEKNAQTVAAFADAIEATLLWERQTWYDLAIQVQTASDQTILSSLEKLTQSARSSDVRERTES